MEEGKRGKIFCSIDMERYPIYSEWKMKRSEEYMLPFEEKNVKQQQNAYMSILLLQMPTEKLGNNLWRRTVARVISREGNSF